MMRGTPNEPELVQLEEEHEGEPESIDEETFVEGTEPSVFVTNPNAPPRGRVFVYAFTKWYEREEGETGAVEFTPIADSYEDLFRQVTQAPGAELTEIDDDFARRVRVEFGEQSALPLTMPPEERAE